MTPAEERFAQFWKGGSVSSVALWADSSYGPFEQPDVLKLAKEESFPLTTFTPAFGGGLTQKADYHDPAGKPAEVVIIQMGYNDESNLGSQEATRLMNQRQWYKVLWKATSQAVKFVMFIHQPTYRQLCPPAKAKYLSSWVRGATVEGSKYTDEAIKLVEELGMQAFCFTASIEELYGDMMTVDSDGVAWQNEAKIRASSNKKKGIQYNADGELAHWEDSEHPTALGADQHFRCLARAINARYGVGNCAGLASGAQVPQHSTAGTAPMQNPNFAPQQYQQQQHQQQTASTPDDWMMCLQQALHQEAQRQQSSQASVQPTGQNASNNTWGPWNGNPQWGAWRSQPY